MRLLLIARLLLLSHYLLLEFETFSQSRAQKLRYALFKTELSSTQFHKFKHL